MRRSVTSIELKKRRYYGRAHSKAVYISAWSRCEPANSFTRIRMKRSALIVLITGTLMLAACLPATANPPTVTPITPTTGVVTNTPAPTDTTAAATDTTAAPTDTIAAPTDTTAVPTDTSVPTVLPAPSDTTA